MRITKEMIAEAFSNTYASKNDLDLQEIFEKSYSVSKKVTYTEDVFNAIFNIIVQLSLKSDHSGYRVALLPSDGGIKQFLLLYDFLDYSVIVEHFYWQYFDCERFNSIDKFLYYLNFHADRIDSYAKAEVNILQNEDFEGKK